eukprot:TRINITY_DN18429_c0_g1_i1.p1 TRINITY_DN18429_c0_g1~~TRINITY_DN18429_c0_g1_i1.p1  ORF type:complete len:924 (+),score=193.05 TRINITY_DN18429_c0_g1_i1:152-2923(+)
MDGTVEQTQIYEGQDGWEHHGVDRRTSGRGEGGHAVDRRQAAPGHEQGRQSHGARHGAAKASRRGLLGLHNLGNTCFMNAALQCLTHTHALQKYFRVCSHAYTSKSQGNRQKLLMSFANWFERDWSKSVSTPYHSPEDILRSVQALNPTFLGYQQQDSQEFLRCVLDNMHEELRREVPDDLDGFLLRRFGIEAELTPSNAASSSGGVQRSSSGERNRLRPAAAAAQSATRQLMQFCQTTEVVADAGEIRLPDGHSATSSTAGPNGPELGQGPEHAIAGSSKPASSSTDAGTSCKEAEDEDVKMHFSSIISELFQGRMVSVVRCLDCGRTSRTEEVVYDVSVPIPNNGEVANGPSLGGADLSPLGHGGPSWTGVFSGFSGKVKSLFFDKGVELQDCLRKHCAPELLSGKDKYFCEHCKRKNDCEKRMFFQELPEVLCVHLKRFKYDGNWFNGSKNSKVVTFPVNRPLDMSCFLESPSGQSSEYRLIGLIQHIGSKMGAGHYIAYCRHKKRPDDWFEFDDLQVSTVSADHVENSEPYVLFYQRMPTKGCKVDRQTCKADKKSVEASIRSYLIRSSLPPSGLPSEVDSHAAAKVHEEMRVHGPAVRNLYKSPPAELDIVFVSKHWYVRMTSMSSPGPVDNFEYLCQHGMLGSHSAELAAEPFMPISRALFKSLVQKYGGGPVISCLDVCPKCQTYIRAYNDRKQAEFDLVSKYDTKDTGDGKHWYLVDALWVNNWKRYVRAEHVTDIRDMCAPGPITNRRLFNKEDPTKFRDKLKMRIDYIGVNARVWSLFMHVHGGGPVICTEELDIYSAPCPVEEELRIGELRVGEDGSNADFVKRVSREFVDECRGDQAHYDERFGEKFQAPLQSDQDMSKDVEATTEGPVPPIPPFDTAKALKASADSGLENGTPSPDAGSASQAAQEEALR